MMTRDQAKLMASCYRDKFTQIVIKLVEDKIEEKVKKGGYFLSFSDNDFEPKVPRDGYSKDEVKDYFKSLGYSISNYDSGFGISWS